jgi:hypothetical protein
MQIELTEAERRKLIYLLAQETHYLTTRLSARPEKEYAFLKDSLQLVVTIANKLSEKDN